MRVTSLVVALLSACLAVGESVVAAQGDAAVSAVRVGVLAHKGREIVPLEWSGVTQRLNAALPDHRFVLVDYDQAGLTEAVRSRALDFVITNSGHYVTLEQEFGVNRIATMDSPWTSDPSQAIGSAIVVRSDDARLQTLADLAGKRVEAVGADAFGGYQVAARELAHAGINPDAFASLRFDGFPMQQIVHAVGSGRADAGIVAACLLEQMAQAGEIDPKAFRVLAPVEHANLSCRVSSRLYPNWPIAALRHTPRDLAKRVAVALLTMPTTSDGYGWGVPTDYQSVNELFIELQIGPYAGLRHWTFEGMVRRYWGWLLLIGSLLAGWVIHTIRAEYLVKARTRALRAEQEERRRLETEVYERRAALDHVSRLGMVGEMATTIAHELNQPLAAIGNFARGMILRIDSGRVEAAPLGEAAKEILAQSDRAAATIRSIRAFSKKRMAERRRIDLRQVLKEGITLFSGANPDTPVHLDDQTGELDGVVVADALQVQQVLLNLLKNALDAQSDAGCPDTPIVVELGPALRGYRIAVRDAGPGLAAEQLARMFEPFFTTKRDGIGLGLAICRSIVEAHGGQLAAVPNQTGPGLTVYFVLQADIAGDANG